ncbi:MAG: 4-hydroxy-3-methylbut-2-enyl diphosphate reductase [Salinivirgaceae bacterium]|jgi:4-hydroxy-3-methylbut-2-enyl diphosphate reductase|nr:4-hydroxy-3-methylbut-2-enyl diphosphate reductase [Salinivirgaceae bacterium]
MIDVEIDIHSGFCFGVVRAIDLAEEHLRQGHDISSLGQMVHNAEEVKRLEEMGMRTIENNAIKTDSNKYTLIRAHGEPPTTYENLRNWNKTIVDATCPIVLKLQERIKKCFGEQPETQIVIYGKPSHAEVIGLVGQTKNTAIVVSSEADVSSIDKTKPVCLFSQTTMPLDGFARIGEAIKANSSSTVEVFDTICRKVSNRVPAIREFASSKDVCVFVSGKNSSNGKMLYTVAKNANRATYRVSHPGEISKDWFADGMSVGVCGATSTPQWQMEKVKTYIERLF